MAQRIDLSQPRELEERIIGLEVRYQDRMTGDVTELGMLELDVVIPPKVALRIAEGYDTHAMLTLTAHCSFGDRAGTITL